MRDFLERLTAEVGERSSVSGNGIVVNRRWEAPACHCKRIAINCQAGRFSVFWLPQNEPRRERTGRKRSVASGAAVALHVTYHNFCWRPRLPSKTGRRRPTPAMSAGLVSELWDFEALYDAVIQHQEDQERMRRLIARFQA